MSRIYIEPTAMFLGAGPGAPGGDESARHPSPGVLEAIANLRDSGHEVVLLMGSDERPQPAEGTRLGLSGLPIVRRIEPVAGAVEWLITADPRLCEQRPAGVRTILIGPRRPPGPRPTAHCDVAARDLSAAAIEILTREAMA